MSGDGRFLPARLVGRSDAGGGLTRVLVEPDASLAPSYVTPGQYVEMCIGEATGFFALASDPGVHPWALVMRAGGGASDVVLELPVGAPIELTGALGEGFPVAKSRGQLLVLALAGTGVAAGPPVVARRVRDRDVGRTVVHVGVRTADEVPLPDTLAQWAEEGIDVTVCVSQGALPAAPPAGVHVASGRVQDVLRHRSRSLSAHPPPRWLFAVGPSSMVEGLRELASEVGVDHVVTNY